MKNRLTEAIGLIDEKYLNECYEKREKRRTAARKTVNRFFVFIVFSYLH